MKQLGFISLFLLSGASLGQTNPNKLDYLRVGLSYDVFSDNLQDWKGVQIEGRKIYKDLSVLPRLTAANRFGKTRLFSEVDVYKHLKNKDYFNVAGGFSSNEIFPSYQFLAEYFNPFKTWEHSLGFTYSYFESIGNLGTIRGSISKYHTNWYSSLRINKSIVSENSINILNIKNENRYYVSDFSYLGFALAKGLDGSLINTIRNSSTKDTPLEFSVVSAEVFYNSRIFSNRSFKLSITWSQYDFPNHIRNQYNLSIFLTSFSKKGAD